MSILPISYVRISQFHLPIPTQKCHMSKMRVKGHSGEKKEEKEEKKKKRKQLTNDFVPYLFLLSRRYLHLLLPNS